LSIVAAANLTCQAGDSTNAIKPAAMIDPDFQARLPALKKAIGILEEPSDGLGFRWAPNLQLLVGMKAAEGSKQTVRFVELITLPPPTTNAAGQPWSAPLRTNRFGWSGTNGEKRTIEFVSRLYPVRLRVFDPAGKQLKEGTVTLPWDLLTNSLAELCRAGLSSEQEKKPAATLESEGTLRQLWGGLLSLVTVFAEIQSAPALSDICEKARCAIRMPSAWSLVKAVMGRSLSVNLDPRFDEISVVEPARAGAGPPRYRLLVDMKCEKKVLTTIEIIAGQVEAAGVLLAGMQSIQAVHPTKTNHVFSAQVLAAGSRASGATETAP
jgi:hypothetical protein